MQSFSEKTNGAKMHWRIYDSFAELADHACEPLPPANARLHWWDGFLSDSRWVGRSFKSWKDAREKASANWQDGTNAVADMLEAIADAQLPMPVSRRRRPCWEEANGDELCHDRLRAGQDFWRTTRAQQSRAPLTVTIVTAMATPSSKDWRSILWRGAAALALATILENAGYRVEIIACAKVTNIYDREGCTLACTLKHASSPLDVATTSAAVSGWGYRTIWFRSKGQHAAEASSSLGTPTALTPSDLAHLTPDADPIVLEQLWDKSAAIAAVRKALLRFA